jgi:hypothetical protein
MLVEVKLFLSSQDSPNLVSKKKRTPNPLSLLCSDVKSTSTTSGVAAHRHESVLVVDSADSLPLLRLATAQTPRQTLGMCVGDTVWASRGQQLLARLHCIPTSCAHGHLLPSLPRAPPIVAPKF